MRIKNITWANRVTLIRMMLIPVFVVVVLANLPNWGPWISAAIFAVLASTDALDGYLARSRNEVTTFGKFMDPLADKLLVTAALIALVQLGKLPAWIAIVIISREFIVSGIRMVAVAEGKVMAASWIGKVKTVFQIVAIVAFLIMDSPLVPTYLGPAGEYTLTALAWAVMVIAIGLTLWSMIDYFYEARDILTGPWTPDAGE